MTCVPPSDTMLEPEYIAIISCGDIGAASVGVALSAVMVSATVKSVFAFSIHIIFSILKLMRLQLVLFGKFAIKMIPIGAILEYFSSNKAKASFLMAVDMYGLSRHFL